MKQAGRDALLACVLLAAVASAWPHLGVSSDARLAPLARVPEPICPVPVEVSGLGVRCLDEAEAASAGLAPGDRLLPDGGVARMAPARLAALGVVLDLNEAPAAELESLPAIGPGLAQRIVSARPFSSVDEVARVQGVGGRRAQALRSRLRLAPRTRNPPPPLEEPSTPP
jgi:hypothetical protein